MMALNWGAVLQYYNTNPLRSNWVCRMMETPNLVSRYFHAGEAVKR